MHSEEIHTVEMHSEEEGRPSSAGLRSRKKPSPAYIVLALAAVAAIIVSSFALAHVLIDAVFRKLGG